MFAILTATLLAVQVVSGLNPCRRTLTVTEEGPLVFGPYSESQKCQWKIIGPVGDQLKLTFVDNFDIDCDSWIKIYDGIRPRGSPVLGKYDNCNQGSSVTTLANVAFIRFKSISGSSGNGWTINVEFVGSSGSGGSGTTACGGTLTGPSSINFPGDGGSYINNADCTWAVSQGSAEAVKLTFTRLDIEADATCFFDQLQINDANAKSVGALCGNIQVDPIYVLGDSISLQFTSDGDIVGSGFEVDVSFVSNIEAVSSIGAACTSGPTVLSGNTGIITLPQLTSFSYRDNSQCSWKIEVASDMLAHIHFDAFSLEPASESSGNCYDFLDIYDGTAETGSLKGKYCGKQRPEDLTASSNIMTLVFSSDGSESSSGFSATYSAKDGGDGGNGGGGGGGSGGNGDCPLPKSVKLPTKIVGGTEAEAHAWPWQVSLRYSSGFHFCGGSVLNNKWVVTAAHCIVTDPITVVAGAHTLSAPSGSEQTRITKRIIKHPNYNSGTNDQDIALLELDNPLTFDNAVKAACLPDTDVVDLQLCAATGWGTTSSGGQASDVLMEVFVPIQPRDTCNSWYTGYTITNYMICAGLKDGGKDTCQGDSGGPLVCPGAGDNYYLQGITSWGVGCAYAEMPGVYTRLTQYTDWINGYINA